MTLREMPDWRPQVTQNQLLCLFREAIRSCNQQALKLLLSLAEQHEVSTDQLQELLLQAIAMASGVAKEAGKVREGSGQPVGARTTKQDCEVQQLKAQVLNSLLGFKAAQQLSPDQLIELLEASTAHGLDVTRALMKLPAGKQLKADHLLASCAKLYGGSILQGQVFKLLLKQPAVKDFDIGSVPRLLAAFVRSEFGKPEPAVDSRATYWSSLLGRNDRSVAPSVDPVQLLIDLPVMRLFDGYSVAELIEACVKSGVRQSVLQSVLALPGAAQMTTKQLLELVELCAQHRQRAAMQLLLKHPAAPDADDPELQLLLCACQ